ncbi:MAG: hypothetical protein ACK4MV_16805 [Beijerinckiaceae bacterium]
MNQQFLIAIGSGLAAALLFFIPVKGTAFAMTIAMFAALPLMIAGLAFSPAAAFVGAVAGTFSLLFGLMLLADVDLGPSLIFCSFFALTAALPAWWLTRLAWLARPAAPGENATPDGLVWYPLGRLALWMGIISAGAVLIGILAAVVRTGSFDAFVTDSAKRIQPIIEQLFGGAKGLPGGLQADELARTFVLATGPIMAAWTAAGLALNLWLAGRISLVSGQMKRPWLDLPENFELPREILPALAGSLALMLIGGLPRTVGAVGAATIGALLVFKGLASLHAGTRRSGARTAILAAVYILLLVLFPLPLPLFAALGLAAMFSTAPGRRPPAPPAPRNDN